MACARTRCSTTRPSRATPPTTSPACRESGRRPPSSCCSNSRRWTRIYERLDEVKGKLRDRLAEHRESAFMSREVGRIIIDLPVELNLDEGRTGRYDRRAVAQRFRELEFRTLIDRLPPSSIAPTGYGPAEQETASGLQLSLDLLGGARPSAEAAAAAGDGATPTEAVADPARRGERSRRGDRARRPADRAQRRRPGRPGDVADCPWRGRRAGLGRRRRAAAGAAAAGDRRWAARTAPPGTCRGATTAPLPGWFSRADRPLIGHDLKQLLTMLARRGVVMEGPAIDTLVASYMTNPSLRAQTLDDLAANRFGASLPERPVSAETGAEETATARRAAAEALTSLLVRPALETELTEGRHERPVHRGRDAAAAGAGAHGAGRGDHRSRPAGGHERRVRRHPGRPGEADLCPGRARVQHRVAEAAGADPLRRAGPAGHEAHADRLFDGCIGPGGAARAARGGGPDPGAPPGVEAEGHLRRRAARAGGQRRAAAHDLPAGRGVHRAAVQHRSQPAEHPDPLRAGAAHPPRLRGSAGQAAARAPTTRSRSCASWPTSRATRDSRPTSPPTPTSTWRPRLACWGCRRTT